MKQTTGETDAAGFGEKTGDEREEDNERGHILERLAAGAGEEAAEAEWAVHPEVQVHGVEEGVTRFFGRGDIPVMLAPGVSTNILQVAGLNMPAPKSQNGNSQANFAGLQWRQDPATIDFMYYYPVFVDGFREPQSGIRILAYLGAVDLLKRQPTKALECLPQFILPLKYALCSPDPEIVITAIFFIKTLITAFPKFGQSLVSYYKQLLPALNSVLLKSKKAASGRLPAGLGRQSQKPVIGPTVAIYESLEKEIEELLTALEKTGGLVVCSNPGSLSAHEVHDSDLPKCLL